MHSIEYLYNQPWHLHLPCSPHLTLHRVISTHLRAILLLRQYLPLRMISSYRLSCPICSYDDKHARPHCRMQVSQVVQQLALSLLATSLYLGSLPSG